MPALFRALFALISALACAPLLAQATLVANPVQVTAGAVFRAEANGISAGTRRLGLRPAGAGDVATSNNTLVGADGRLRASLTVPANLGAGGYHLVVVAVDSGAVLASTPVDVLAPLDLALPADPVDPGASFEWAASGLVPGTVELLEGGRVIAGPFPVDGPAFGGDAVLPSDVLAGGGGVQLIVHNLQGDQRVGYGEARVPLSGTAAGAEPVLRDLVFPSGGVLSVGEPFTVSGRLETPRRSPLGLEARVVLRTASGRVMPLGEERAPLAADGSFSLRASPGSVLRNAAAPLVGQGGEAFVVFTEPEPSSGRSGFHRRYSAGQVAFAPPPADPPDPELVVTVLDVDGQPVADAIVVIDTPDRAALGQPEATESPVSVVGKLRLDPAPAVGAAKALAPADGGNPALQAVGSQTATALAGLQDPLQGTILSGECPLSLARGVTDAQGRFRVRFDRDMMALKAQIADIGQGVGAFGSPADIEHQPVVFDFRILVNAVRAGQTFSANAQPPLAAEYRVEYRFASNSFHGFEPATGEFSQPLGSSPAMAFRARAAYAGPQVYPVFARIGDLPPIAGPGMRFGPITTFPDPVRYPLGVLQAPTGLVIRVTTNEALFGPIESVRLLSVAPGNVVTEVATFSRDALQCAFEDVTFIGLLPQPARLPHSADGLRYRIEVDPLGVGGEPTRHDFRIVTEPPPAWFETMPLDTRRVAWTPKQVTLTGEQERPERATQADPGLGIGTVRNRSQALDRYVQAITPEGLDGITRTSSSSNEAANQDASPAATSGPVIGEQWRYGPEYILDTGLLPLFRFSWGVPPIAAATFGVDAWFWAQLEILAQASYEPLAGRLEASVETTPTVGGLIKAFFDFSAIFGLVEMTAAFGPEFSVAMTTVVRNNAFVESESLPCLLFRMFVEYSVGVGICPVCVEFSDEAYPFSARDPEAPYCSFGPSNKQGSARKLLADLGIERLRRPSIAFDALGRGSLVEVDAAGRVVERPWTPSGWGAAQDLGAAAAASEVAHAAISPGHSLMVYAASTLSDDAFRNASLDGAVSSRRIVWREKIGSGAWSAPQVLGSNAGGGEGEVAIAACADGEAGCPAGGALYAAWTRSVGTDPFAFRYEVWGARFSGGAWTTPERLADPGAGADLHPSVAWVGGVPTVAFARMDARDASAFSSRRLMLRRVTGGALAFDAGAPAGVLWIDAGSDAGGELVLAYTVAAEAGAVIGNQGLLWAARGGCSGGSCTLVHEQQRDGFSRAIRAEAPSVLRTSQGVRFAYRGLGFGPDPLGQRFLPGDTLGLVTGAGEFMLSEPLFAGAGAPPLAISGDGRLHLRPVLAEHPVNRSLLGASNTSLLPVADAKAVQRAVPQLLGKGAVRGKAVSDGITAFSLANAPDLELLDADAGAAVPVPGGTLAVDLVVLNRGPQVRPGGGGAPLTLGASWNEAWNAGVAQSSILLPDPDAQGMIMATLQVPVPAGLDPDAAHALFLRVDPEGAVDEVGTANNERVVVVGALPVPGEATALVRPDDRHAAMSWPEVADDRVVGYRIYREFAPGDWQPIGASNGSGFVDLMTEPRQRYRYRVASYAANGAESLPGPVLTVDLVAEPRVFGDGFEPPPGID